MGRDAPIAVDLRPVAHPANQPIGDARRPPGPVGYLHGPPLLDLQTHDPGRSRDDLDHVFISVETKAEKKPEPAPQRRRQHAGTRRGPDQSERFQVQSDRFGVRAFPDQNIEFVILHGRIEAFFNHSIEPVNFIDEQNVAPLQVRQNGGQIVLALDDGSRCRLQRRAHLSGDNVGKRGLAQPGGAGQEDVVQRLIALPGRLDGQSELSHDVGLADEIGAAQRTQRLLRARALLFVAIGGKIPGHKSALSDQLSAIGYRLST